MSRVALRQTAEITVRQDEPKREGREKRKGRIKTMANKHPPTLLVGNLGWFAGLGWVKLVF